MADQQARFYRYFQETVSSLQEKIEQLETYSTAGGERQDATEDILAGISRLSNEVADAASFVPAYDQKIYAQTVKGLSESLNETTARLAPKSRFQFKSRGTFGGGSAGAGPSKKADPARTTGDDKLGELPSRFATSSATAESKNYNDQLSRPGISGIRKPSFSTAKEIAINDHMGLHIILPSSASRATSSGKLANLARCIVDMSVPTVSGSSPFASLALRDVRKSLVVAGRVAGSVHITGVTDSVIVVQARQVRIHECKNTVFYLHCGSHPIIEDCENVKFAPMPQCLLTKDEDPGPNQWDQVDDFKWLKAEPSPNWSIVPEDQRIPEEVWTKTVPGGPGLSLDGILKVVGVPTAR